MLADVFPTVYDLHDMALYSGILQGMGIYYSLGNYCSLQSYHLVHVESVRPIHSFIVSAMSWPGWT